MVPHYIFVVYIKICLLYLFIYRCIYCLHHPLPWSSLSPAPKISSPLQDKKHIPMVPFPRVFRHNFLQEFFLLQSCSILHAIRGGRKYNSTQFIFWCFRSLFIIFKISIFFFFFFFFHLDKLAVSRKEEAFIINRELLDTGGLSIP